MRVEQRTLTEVREDNHTHKPRTPPQCKKGVRVSCLTHGVEERAQVAAPLCPRGRLGGGDRLQRLQRLCLRLVLGLVLRLLVLGLVHGLHRLRWLVLRLVLRLILGGVLLSEIKHSKKGEEWYFTAQYPLS